MYEPDDINNDFSNNSASFCRACLSFDRKLSTLGEYVDIYKNISNISFDVLPKPVHLCWECIAVLKKIKLFKAKVEEAHRILMFHCVNKQKSLLRTLSKLTKEYTDNTIIITHNDIEKKDEDDKQKIDIKQEKDHFDDDFDYDQNTNNYGDEEIKLENVVVEKNTIKKPKATHYRIVCAKNKVLRKKISVSPDDYKIWLAREKNSDYYKKKKIKCKLCMYGFNVKEKLEAHILKYHEESIGSHICQICNMRFSSECSLSEHIQRHSCAWECTRCGFQAYTLSRLNAHLKTHSAVQCAYCDAQFPDLTAFYSHYKTLHSVFVCEHCGKRCKTKRMIEKHMSHHLDIHTCSSCARRYKSKAALRKHFALKHGDTRAEDAYCVLCDKQYANVLVYRRHVQTSSAHAQERDKQDNKKFPCPECSNIYSRRVYMMNHYRHVHTNQSKHYCSECDRHFLNRTRYIDHMRYNHEGVKKDKNKLCNICGRGFAANRTLMNHIRTHSGERPYECEYCSAKFAQRTSMLSHVKYIHMKSKRRAQWQQ